MSPHTYPDDCKISKNFATSKIIATSQQLYEVDRIHSFILPSQMKKLKVTKGKGLARAWIRPRPGTPVS